jgi:hypothetical protein
VVGDDMVGEVAVGEVVVGGEVAALAFCRSLPWHSASHEVHLPPRACTL